MKQNRTPSNSVTLLTGSDIDRPPEPDEVEVSIFGPGYGESIVLHIGENKWFIIDSCINPASQEPAVLTYLRQMHLAPSIVVRQVVATHWHDDHIRGIGKIFQQCHAARFVCSAALRAQEFVELVEAYGMRSMMRSSGIEEMSQVMTVLKERRQRSDNPYLSPIFASADRCIWHDSLKSLKPHPQCFLYTLSPSDSSLLAAKHDLCRLFPKQGEPKKRLLSSTPNHSSVVILVQIADLAILLGSDLEETGNPERGWSVIISSNFKQGHSLYQKASLFKIPHHGSLTAHHPSVWTKMLVSDPIAALTPFRRGGVYLPGKDDALRIHSLTEKAYSSSTLHPLKKKKRERTVEKTIKETVLNMRQLNPTMGHIRFRRKLSKSWTVELFGDAIPVAQLYSY